MDSNFFYLSNVTDQELFFLKEITKNMNEEQRKTFSVIYDGKRRDPQHLLLFTLLGFFGAAGIQRFLTNQIALGILYFFTVGLCFIGTIVDLINYKSMANEYNYKMAMESARILSLG
ncbi:TM2 domain-containing protein [Pseudopedobacter beijingensis]|uniref:TM2 domain-containing protein n=1 Tax=Pseudopedobacter beijingensis TaxID=1207056 RepID=A0ABW4I857_9SPHI